MGIRMRCDPAIELIDTGLGLLFALSDRATADDLGRVLEALAALPFEQAQRFVGIVDIGKYGDGLAAWRTLTEAAGYSRDDPDLQWLRWKVRDMDRLRGMSRSLLDILAVRGFEPTVKVRTRILTAELENTVEGWIKLAATAEDLSAHFSEEVIYPPRRNG